MFCTSCNFDLRGLPSAKCPECGRAFDPADAGTFLIKPRSAFARMFKRIALAAVVLIVGGIVLSVCLFVRAAHTAIDAEYRYQVPSLVCDLIIEYVKKSPTHSWPASWKDLEGLPPREAMCSWPREADKVRSYVTVDFTLSVADVLKQTPQSCTAVKQTPGPTYGTSPALHDFFDRLRAATETPKPAPPKPPTD